MLYYKYIFILNKIPIASRTVLTPKKTTYPVQALLYFENELLVGSQEKKLYRYGRDGENLGSLKSDMRSVTCLCKYHKVYIFLYFIVMYNSRIITNYWCIK